MPDRFHPDRCEGARRLEEALDKIEARRDARAFLREEAMIIWLRVLLVLATLASSNAFAQQYPTRSVTIVAATTPGSLPDVLARGIGQRLSQKWGQPVVVENRAGGAYAIAASAVANAPADGYTLLASESGLYTIQPHLSKGRPAYAPNDFVPASGMASIPVAFVAHPSLEANSVRDLIALATAKPGQINYGTAGPGTSPHMAMLLLASMAKVKLTAVHYRGISPALNDLVAGHVQLLAIGPSVALPAFKAGKVKILGVGGGQPVPQLPGVPTVAEAVPGFEMNVSFPIFARVGTPQEVISKINTDVQQVIRDQEFQKQFLEPQALQPMLGSPEQLMRLLEADSEKWGRLIREANLTID
jgi:tripartite-type tricarboxylate transporter receptor subunit TctC